MFASLKNKIREETGNDVVMKVNPPMFNKRGTLRGRHSGQGSTTSLNSIVSAEGSCTDDQNNSSTLSSSRIDEDELQKIISRKELEFERRLKDKEKEWRRQLDEKNNERTALEKQREDLESRIQELEDVLQITEGQKRKLAAYRDDKEQLENLQAQEISKVKQLLLAREKELANKSTLLRDSNELVESLRAQISRLRHNEQELSCVQENSGEQLKELRDRLAEAELRADNAQIECSRVTVIVEKEQHINKALRGEIEGLKRELETEQKRCIELCASFDKERSEKDVTLLRNAQVSQEVEIARQKIVNQDSELNELHARLTDLEKTIILKDSQIHKCEDEVSGLKNNIGKLEEDVLERDKNIKILQHRLAIMKKTLQRELRSNDTDQSVFLGDAPGGVSEVNNFTSAAVLSPSSNTTKHIVAANDSLPKFNVSTPNEEDINFKYLKHVIIKFLTSREYEAKHLTRAVATLLKFSPDEERLLHETLEWKMSWFGSRPKLGNGQLAKAIPPS